MKIVLHQFVESLQDGFTTTLTKTLVMPYLPTPGQEIILPETSENYRVRRSVWAVGQTETTIAGCTMSVDDWEGQVHTDFTNPTRNIRDTKDPEVYGRMTRTRDQRKNLHDNAVVHFIDLGWEVKQ